MARNNNSRNNIGSSWDAYNEPSSNNNRSFNNNRVNNNRMHQQQNNNTEQDAAIWNQYDKEHGSSHPNNAHLVHNNRSNGQMNRYNNNNNKHQPQPSMNNSRSQQGGAPHNNNHYQHTNHNSRSNNNIHNNIENNQSTSSYHPPQPPPPPPPPNTQSSYNNQHQQPPPYYSNNSSSNKIQLQVLYTHQKTKKKKSWKDGKLTLTSNGHCTLHDACPIPGQSTSSNGSGGVIDTLELTKSEAASIINGAKNNGGYINDCELESEKYLIQIEGLWIEPNQVGGGVTSSLFSPSWPLSASSSYPLSSS